MKKIQQVAVLMLLMSVLVIFTLPTIAREYTFEVSGGGPFLFETTSTFFNVHWAIENGFGNIRTNGPNLADDFSFASLGKVQGRYFIDAENLEKEILFIDPGAMQSITSTSSIVTVLSFTGSGWIEQQINIGAGFTGLTGIYMFFDADYIFLYIRDDKPEHKHEPRPLLRLISTSTNGNDIAMSVENVGDAGLYGEAFVSAGLSYRPDYWVPESVTHFSEQSLGNGSMAPGEIFTFFFTIPDISEDAFQSFLSRRGLFTSFDYPDPLQDCIGLSLKIGQQSVFGFLPLNYNASLGIESVSVNEKGEAFLTVKNFGIFEVAGPTKITASIASEENYSVPEAWIEFSQLHFEDGILTPGDAQTFKFQLPEVPAWIFDALEEQEGEFGQTYVKIRLFIGNKEVSVSIAFNNN